LCGFSPHSIIGRKSLSCFWLFILEIENRKMFRYTSVQTHSEYKNGKRRTKTKSVKVNGKKGYKFVTFRNNSGTKKSKKPLTRKEIACIRKCQFIPGLFDDCKC
jgi:hypothetical protein